MKKAVENKTFVVSADWVKNSAENGQKMDETKYLLNDDLESM